MSKPTPAQLRAKAARYLREQGHSLGEVSAALGVSKTQVSRMCQPLVTNADVLRELDAWLAQQRETLT
jgi:hypothetical protein